MKTVLKLIALAAALLLAGGILWVYTSFNGDPLSAWLARRTMEKYLTETYPDKTFTVQEVHYNFKFNSYEAQVVEGTNHFFQLTGSPRKVKYDQYKYTFAMDEVLTNRFSAQLKDELKALLKPGFPQLSEISSDFYVAKDEYPADAKFTRGMERVVNLEISLIGEEMPAVEFTRQCAGMRDAVLQAGYQPASLRFLYNEPEVLDGKGGMLLYVLKIEQDAFTAPVDKLQAGVEEFNLQHRGK